MPPRGLLTGAVVAAVAAGALVAYALVWPERYEAEARLQVTPVASADARFPGFSLLRADRGDDAATAARLVTTRPVAESVAERLRLGTPEDALEGVEAIGENNVVRIRAEARDPIRAAQIANAFADAFVRERSTLFQRDLGEELARLRVEARATQGNDVTLRRRMAVLEAYQGQRDPTLQIAGAAVAPKNAASPHLRRLLVLGLPAAIALGALAGFAARGGRWHPAHGVRVDANVPDALTRPDESARSAPLVERDVAHDPRDASPAPTDDQGPADDEPGPGSRELERDDGDRVRDADQHQMAARRPHPELAQPPEAPAIAANEARLRPSSPVRLATLERLVGERFEAGDDRVIEWRAYLVHLREHADVDGRLPPSLDELVREVFGELLGET